MRSSSAFLSGRSSETGFTADPAKALFAGPVVALIDTGSAGAAEVLASALIERNRAQVVGEKSFGAGTEQQLFTLRGGEMTGKLPGRMLKR